MQAISHSIVESNTDSLCTSLKKFLDATPSSVTIAYSNCVHSTEDIRSVLEAQPVPFMLATSCLGALHCSAEATEAESDVSVLCIKDEIGAYGIGSVDLADNTIADNDPQKAGAHALEQALANAGRPYESPALIWCALPPGDEERILEGFASVVGEQVPIFGGSAADNAVEGSWHTATAHASSSNTVAVCVMYPSTPLGLSYSSGYKPTDTVFTITKANGRNLIELDGQPASAVYNQATNNLIESQLRGGQILGLTSSAPLGKPVELENEALNYLLCHPDQVCEDGSLNVFSETHQGEQLTLMEGNIESLTSRAERVINNAIMLLPQDKTPVGVLMIYCAGCRLMVGDAIKPMINNLQETFEGLPICGAFTFGEQGRFLDGKNRHGNLMISAVVFSQ
jgi:hypothetical protein